MKRYLLNGLMLLGLLIALLAFLPIHSTASGNAQKGGDDFTKDMPEVQWYADYAHVSLDEAVRRLRLQNVIDEMDANIRENYDDIFAGIFIQHKPEYKVVVQFARTIPSEVSRLIPKSLRNDTEIRQVRFSQKELTDAGSHAIELLKTKGIRAVSYTDRKRNMIMLSVDSASLVPSELDSDEKIREFLISEDASLLGKFEVGLDLIKIVPLSEQTVLNDSPPAKGDVVKNYHSPSANSLDRISSPNDDSWRYVKGGAKLYAANGSSCTSGFSVYRGPSDERGISTAGHCNDMVQYFHYIDLEPRWGTNGGIYDVRWYATPGWQVTNQIFKGTWGIEDIWGDKWRWQQHVGDWVCKYGRASGPACTTILINDFQGVNIVTELEVQPGDSGGPWWLNQTAYGTTISQVQFTDGSFGSCYAPVDHLYHILGVRPLTWR